MRYMKYLAYIITILAFVQIISFALARFVSTYKNDSHLSLDDFYKNSEALINFLNYTSPSFLFIFEYQYYIMAVYTELGKDNRFKKGCYVALSTSLI